MSTGGDLPCEMIVEIVVRLPTKSVGRFKCVSKFWRTFISDPNFAKTHFNQNNCRRRRRPKLLISNGRFAEVVDIDGEPYVSSPKIYIKQTPNWFPWRQEWYHIYGTCHGLILAHALIDDYAQYILLNPTTQDCKILPHLPRLRSYIFVMTCGFGYDSVSDDYKVVVIFYARDVYVYSLRNDSWRRVHDRPIDHDGDATNRYAYSGAFLNGCIHWIGNVPSSSSSSSSSSVSVINAFDLADEKFKIMPLPHELRPLASKVPSLWLQQVSGCLLCLKKSSDYQEGIDVWVMKDYGIESSWTKYGGITKGNVMHKYLRANEHFRPVFYLPNEELVLIHKDMIEGINVATYNVKEKTSTNVRVPGLPYTFDLSCTFQDSLVSLEQFNRGTTPCLH